MNLKYRKANIEDLPRIIALLLEDDLGSKREPNSLELKAGYKKAFQKIDQDSNQYLMVMEDGQEIIATCNLTIMPFCSLQ